MSMAGELTAAFDKEIRLVNALNDAIVASDDVEAKLRSTLLVLELVLKTVDSLLEPEDRESIDKMMSLLYRRRSEHGERSHKRAQDQRVRAHTETPEEWLARQKREAEAKDHIPVRGTTRKRPSGQLPPGYVPKQVDPDGRVWSQSLEKLDNPLDDAINRI
jgi:hypothetical protein